jgi:hypothetical protein
MTIYIYLYNYDSDISIPYFLSGLGVLGGLLYMNGGVGSKNDQTLG